LGRTDIAHTSEGDNWNGQQLNRVRDHYSKLRAALQRKASKGTLLVSDPLNNWLLCGIETVILN